MTAITEYVQLDKSAPNDKKSANSIKKKKKKKKGHQQFHTHLHREDAYSIVSLALLYTITHHIMAL